jgi:hypothetical protein
MDQAPDDAANGSRPVPREEPSDIAAIEDLDSQGAAEELDPKRAYEVLEIRTPLEEFETYVRARIDTLSRLGDTDKANLASEALELGRRALARVTGLSPVAEKSGPVQEKAPR